MIARKATRCSKSLQYYTMCPTFVHIYKQIILLWLLHLQSKSWFILWSGGNLTNGHLSGKKQVQLLQWSESCLFPLFLLAIFVDLISLLHLAGGNLLSLLVYSFVYWFVSLLCFTAFFKGKTSDNLFMQIIQKHKQIAATVFYDSSSLLGGLGWVIRGTCQIFLLDILKL